MLDLFLTCGKLVLAAAVGDVNMLRAQALRHARGVHRHVARADDADVVEVLDGGVVIVAVGLHEVDAGEKLIGGIHAQQILAGDVQELRQTSAGADEHGLIPVGEKLIHGLGLADDGVVDDLDAHGLEVVYLGRDYLLRQTELRDTVDQNTAGLMERLVHRDVIAHSSEVARTAQARRAGADDRDAVPVGGWRLHGGLDALVHMVVGNKTLQTADGHTLALDAAHALGFALLLLRADTAGNGGEGVGGGDDIIRRVKIALGDLGDELRDAHGDGAAGAARGLLAVEAAARLGDGRLGGIAQRDLVKVAGADNGVLLGHGVLEQTLVIYVGGKDLGEILYMRDGRVTGVAGEQLFAVLLNSLDALVSGLYFPNIDVLFAVFIVLDMFDDIIRHFSFLLSCCRYALRPRPALPYRRRRA